VLAAAAPAGADERSQDFSSNPGWDGLGNRSSLACTAR
jgi:hypothetical protein